MDLSKLTPAPWFVGKNRDAHTVRSLVDMEGEEPVGKSESFTVANCWSGTHATRLKLSVTNAEFIALARNAFDIMLRLLWNTQELDGYWIVFGRTCPLKVHQWSETQHFTDPFTALVESEKWYAAK